MKLLYIILFIIGTHIGFCQPANDTCANSETITLSTANLTVNFFINNATLNNENGCSDSPETFADIWYNFTIPVNGNIYIDGNIIWNQFAIYDACNGNLLACNSGELYATNISANTNLLLRVFRTENLADEGAFQSFDIHAFEIPSNDSCETSINIPLTQTLQESVSFTIGGSDINNGFGCSDTSLDYADVWYDFTMPFDGNIIIDGSILWNKFEIYDGCGGTSLYCSQDELFALGLIGNTNYKLRVYRNTNQAFSELFLNFTIQAFESATNNSCGTAEPIIITENTTSIPFNIGGATIDNITGCTSDIQDYSDVWFQFTLNETSDITIDGNIIWNKFQLFTNCNTSSLGCFEQSGTFSNLPSGSYHLRVFRELAQGSNSSFVSFSISKSSTLGTNIIELSNIEIHPIPAKENLTVSTTDPISRLEIYNLLGQRVSYNTNQNTINISQLKSGMYSLKITIDNTSVEKRILIE
ncbi:T9SS type A sorting domain-containing protein [uncultured Winogradskyella sp.]|uniref:T9SS type A sorting domain-containing protein n=1 Tax=uncultured Winogradskyella sp. TaxID=395353 RepID=UPI0026136D3D|nr:T9SS type A sorting domain-containing protein [uncultured Winogradskyella sp.]